MVGNANGMYLQAELPVFAVDKSGIQVVFIVCVHCVFIVCVP